MINNKGYKMAKFKDFGAGGVDPNAEPIKFSIHGEEFTCLPEIQGKVLLELIADSGSDDAVRNAEVSNKFFSKVMAPESLERFNAMLTSQDKIVSVETLGEITGWLVEQYADRPETRSQG
jgi:hypothetical protein